MKLMIIQEDIDLGVTGSAVMCPIALALNRHFGPHFEGHRAWVIKDSWHHVLHCDGISHDLSEQAQLFIDKYDNGGKVEPQEIEL